MCDERLTGVCAWTKHRHPWDSKEANSSSAIGTYAELPYFRWFEELSSNAEPVSFLNTPCVEELDKSKSLFHLFGYTALSQVSFSISNTRFAQGSAFRGSYENLEPSFSLGCRAQYWASRDIPPTTQTGLLCGFFVVCRLGAFSDSMRPVTRCPQVEPDPRYLCGIEDD